MPKAKKSDKNKRKVNFEKGGTMVKKIIQSMVLCSLVLSAGFAVAQELDKNEVITVCRSKQCRLADLVMTREFMYNKLASMLHNNIGKELSFCEADPVTRTCTADSISFDSIVGVTPSTVSLYTAQVLDSKALPDDMTLKFVLDYQLSVGEIIPACQASLSKIVIEDVDSIYLETTGFECQFNDAGSSTLNASYDVDYLDFDYGVIGAYYSIAAEGETVGGNSGYALIHFDNKPNPENTLIDDYGCVCDDKQMPPCQCSGKRATGNVEYLPLPVVEETVVTEYVPQPVPVVKEKIVKEYQVAPVEVFVKTSAPVGAGAVQPITVNGVTVDNVPVIGQSAPMGDMNAKGISVMPAYNAQNAAVSVAPMPAYRGETAQDFIIIDDAPQNENAPAPAEQAPVASSQPVDAPYTMPIENSPVIMTME